MTGVDEGIYDRTRLLKEYVENNLYGDFSILSGKSETLGIIDLQGNFIYVNHCCMELTGYTYSEFEHINLIDLIRDETVATSNLYSETVEQVDARLLTKAKEELEVSLTFIPIFHEQTLIGKFVVVKAATHMERQEQSEQALNHERLKKRNMELSILSEKLSVAGQLAAGIAHEIRNPVTAIKGFLQLIRNGYAGSEDYYHVMDSEIDRIEVIIKELLVLAKPNNKKYQEHDITLLVDQVVTLMESQALLNDIKIEKKIRLKKAFIMCDDNQMKQVFINFIKNAIEAMPRGGKLMIEAENREDDVLLIRVVDEGCGIPEEMLERIGEPFFTTKENGTGLGMLVSKQIVEEHNGSLNIISDSGGTCVEVHLPLYFRENE